MSSWTASYKDVKSFVDEVYDLIRSASEVENSGQQSAQRGACRRKLQSLTTKIDDLERSLDNEQVTQREASRRSELVSALKVRRDQLKDMLSSRSNERSKLLGGAGGAGGGPRAIETDSTAGLDSQGIIQLQKQALRSQDDQIEELGRAVRNTKHVALAINDEVDLQQRLLDDLDDAVDHTEGYMKFARRKLEQVSRKSGSCRYIMIMILLMVVLALVIAMSKMLTS